MSDTRLGDLDRKASASASAATWAERTHAFRKGKDGECDPELRGHFAQSTTINGARIATTTDGIGTKVEIAERTRIYDTLAFDLMAMVTDDLAAAGATPLTLTNVLDVDKIDDTTVDALMRGLHDAAKVACVSVTGGEIAELGARVGGFGDGMHFNWCATAIGHYPPGRMPLTGKDVHVGDVVVALASPGFRSNGFSLLRRILEGTFGTNWHEAEALGSTWGALALTKSVIYAPLVSELLDAGVGLTGACHVTGGGIPNKLFRVLSRTGLGANLTHLCGVPVAAIAAQKLGAVSDYDAYRAWNMGQGFLLVAPERELAAVERASANHGHAMTVAGRIDDLGSIRLLSRGLDGGTLTYTKEKPE